jgi:uncharacterized protein YoxC
MGNDEKTKTKTMTRKELDDRLRDLEAKIDDFRVLGAELEGRKRKELAEKVERLEKGLQELAALPKAVEELQQYAAHLEGKLANAFATLKEVVNSTNAANVLLSSIERHLDETIGEDWDHGVRKEVEARAELLKARRDLMARSQRSKELGNEERNDLARELWRVAKELGTVAQDVAMVISLYLQTREIDRALDVVEELAAMEDVSLDPQVAEVIQQLIDRCADIAKDQENEIAERRVATIPTLVDPAGRPISSS